MRGTRTLLLITAALGLLGATGCVQHHYCVRRAALVPAPAPMMRPIRQAIGYAEANVSSETAAYAKPPRKLEGANVGLYLPREQLAGQLLFSPHPAVNLGFSFEAGMPGSALPVSRGLIRPPNEAIGGGGVHFGLNFKVNRWVTVGWSCDAWSYAVTSRVAYYEVPNENSPCSGLPDPRNWPSMHKSTLLFVGRTQLGVGLDFGWSHLSFGAGVRNQPHNVDESKETEYYAAAISPRITSAVYPFVYAIWEVRVAKWFYIGATVYQPLNFDPIIYAPIFGISLRLTHVARERTDWVGPPPKPVPVSPFTF